MLKLVHVQARLSLRNGQASVRQMAPSDPIDWQRASEVITLFQKSAAECLTREKLFEKLAAYSGNRLDYREIDGLAKVICDSFSTFAPDRLPFTPHAVLKVDLEPGPDADKNPHPQNHNKNNLAEETEQFEEPFDEGDTESGTRDTEESDNLPVGLAATLGNFRLAVWREAARPEFSPFHRPGLTVALKPGLQSLRKVAASHDENLLANLLPKELRKDILQSAASASGYVLSETAPSWPGEMGNWLFADVPDKHRLVSLHSDLNVENLLNRYNIELLRGVLYLAPRIRLVVRDKYKDLFKFIKLFRLMHEIKPLALPSQNSARPGNPGQFEKTSYPSVETPAVEETGGLTEEQIGGYEIILEGASSPFLARTDRRYGIQFARFLPALLLCEAEWQLETELIFPAISSPGNKANSTTSRPESGADVYRASYHLGPQPHLRTHFKGSGEFDSILEENLATAFEQHFQTTSRVKRPEGASEPVQLSEVKGFEATSAVDTEETGGTGKNSINEQPVEAPLAGKKKGRSKRKKVEGERQGWVIKREDRIIPVFDTVMIPDFAFEHHDGRRVLLEIVGFWERGYLERKIAKLNRAGRKDLIVLVSERTRCGREHFLVKGQEPPYQLIFFKGKPQLGPILAALEKCAPQPRVSVKGTNQL